MSIEDFTPDDDYKTPSGSVLKKLARNPHQNVDVVHGDASGGGGVTIPTTTNCNGDVALLAYDPCAITAINGAKEAIPITTCEVPAPSPALDLLIGGEKWIHTFFEGVKINLPDGFTISDDEGQLLVDLITPMPIGTVVDGVVVTISGNIDPASIYSLSIDGGSLSFVFTAPGIYNMPTTTITDGRFSLGGNMTLGDVVTVKFSSAATTTKKSIPVNFDACSVAAIEAAVAAANVDIIDTISAERKEVSVLLAGEISGAGVTVPVYAYSISCDNGGLFDLSFDAGATWMVGRNGGFSGGDGTHTCDISALRVRPNEANDTEAVSLVYTRGA